MTAVRTVPRDSTLPALPRRARQLIPTGFPRRGELIAACAVALVLAHLLLAQLTLVLAVLFVVVSRTSRWRLWWLLAPAAAGLAWTLAVGPDQALAGFTAGPSVVLTRLGFENAASQHGHPLAAFSGIGGWLPRQFPVALPLAAAEAAVGGWLTWLHTDEWAVPPARPGAVAALRAAVTFRVIRSGAVVTRDGCALGLTPATGAVAELRWAEAARGVLVAGADDREVTVTALQVVHAALRRRKPVIVLDDEPGAAVEQALTAACRAAGTPLVRTGSGALTTGAQTGGTGDQSAATGAAGARTAGTGTSGAQAAGSRAADTRAVQATASASQLWGRARASADPAPGQAGSEQGQAGPEPGRTDPEPVPVSLDPGHVDLSQVIMERTAALLRADSPETAAGACAGLGSLAADLRRIGVDGDALIWVPHGDRVPAPALARLLREGVPAGLSVLVGTTSPVAAGQLAALVGTLLVRRVTDPGLAVLLAARTGTRLLPLSTAMALDGQRSRAGEPAAPPPVPGTVPAPPLGPGTGAAWTGTAWTGTGTAPAASPSAELVPGPAVPGPALLNLGPAEFVLAVGGPRPRLIAPGQLVPARLPSPPRHLSAPDPQSARGRPSARGRLSAAGLPRPAGPARPGPGEADL